MLLLWLLLAFSSCVFGGIVLEPYGVEWVRAASSTIPKILMLIMFVILWSSCDNLSGRNEYAAKGFLYGCLFNCLWAVLDAASYYIMGFSINNIVFSDYAIRNHLRYDVVSLVFDAQKQIRASGFNYDPATGKSLEFDDVVSDTSDLPDIIFDELIRQNPDLKAYFDELPSEYSHLWMPHQHCPAEPKGAA